MKRTILTLLAALVIMFGMSVCASAQSRPRGGGGGGGGQAAPRGGSHVSAPAPSAPPAGAQQRGGSPRTGSARPRGESSGGGVGQAAARPRGSGPIYGTATPRTYAPYGRIILPNRYYISPFYYSPYAFGAFGLGYWGWDPFWWGGYWGNPYWGWGSPYWGYGYGYGYGYDYGYYDRSGYRDYGSLKLKVKPDNAEVYVDGYYMGQVDDFDGVFQHLDLESGPHRIEIRAEGYQPLVIEMRIEPGRTVTYENQLRRSR